MPTPCGRWTGAVYVIDEENPGYRKTQDLDLLRILGSHPGAWSLEAAKFLALGMSATSPQARTVPAEIMVDVVGRRISALGMGAGFSQVVAKVKITRWIGALTEAAQNSAEGSLTVTSVLTYLLPRLERDTHRLGGLMNLLLDGCIRAECGVQDPVLRVWLEGFRGSGQAAKAARRLLQLTA